MVGIILLRLSTQHLLLSQVLHLLLNVLFRGILAFAVVDTEELLDEIDFLVGRLKVIDYPFGTHMRVRTFLRMTLPAFLPIPNEAAGSLEHGRISLILLRNHLVVKFGATFAVETFLLNCLLFFLLILFAVIVLVSLVRSFS